MEQNAAKTLQEYLTGIGIIGRPNEVVLELYRAHGLKGTREALVEFEDSIKFVNKHLGTDWTEDLMIWLEQDDIVGDIHIVDVVVGYASNCIKYPVRASLLDSADRNISAVDLDQIIRSNARAVYPCTAEEPGLFLNVSNNDIGSFWEDYDQLIENEDNG